MAGLIERAGDLKQALVRFAKSERFAQELRKAKASNLDWQMNLDDGEAINQLDHFILEHPLEDGLTIVDHFVEAHPELSPQDCDLVLSWKDVVQGIFEIERHENGALVAVNLADDLTYRIRSNKGALPFQKMPPRSFLIARLVPLGEEWMLSGVCSPVPAASKNAVYAKAREMVMQAPALVFRNPTNRERAIEMQREEKRDFMAFFGSDMIALPSKQFEERMNAYMRFRVQQTRASAAEGTGQNVLAQEEPLPPALRFPRLDWIDAVETIGVIYYDVEGMTFCPDYGFVVEAFADSELARKEPYHETLLDYIQSADISPLPIRMLADRDPERATQLFRNLLPRPGFAWKRDGMKLLHRYKWRQALTPSLPSIIPISERLSQANTASPDKPEPSTCKKVGRNKPCPSGAGECTSP